MFSNENDQSPGDPIIKALNQKLKQSGDTRRFQESQDHTLVDNIISGLNCISSNKKLKQKYLNGEKISLVRDSANIDFPAPQSQSSPAANKQPTPKMKSTAQKKKSKPDKRESQIRSFFGQNFKEKKYKQKKEMIIQAVLVSKTKQQVNNTLMKSFSSKDTGVIYKRLSPLLTSLPGK